MLKTVSFLLLIIILSGCADVSPHAKECVTDNPCGFFSGVWHGLIMAFSFIGSLFSDDIAVYAYNNTGGWYDFGFLIGAASTIGGASKSSSK